MALSSALKENLGEVHVVAVAASALATEAEAAFLGACCGLRRAHRCSRASARRLAEHLRAEGEVLDLALLVVATDEDVDDDDGGGVEERLLREAFDSLEPLARHLALLGPLQGRWCGDFSGLPGFRATRLAVGEQEGLQLLLLLRQGAEAAAAHSYLVDDFFFFF